MTCGASGSPMIAVLCQLGLGYLEACGVRALAIGFVFKRKPGIMSAQIPHILATSQDLVWRCSKSNRVRSFRALLVLFVYLTSGASPILTGAFSRCSSVHGFLYQGLISD